MVALPFKKSVAKKSVTYLGLAGEKMPPTPFVLSPNVEPVWPPPHNGVFLDRLLDEVQNTSITKRDLNIAETLFRHRYLSVHHLSSLFFADVDDKKFIGRKLEKLTSFRILSSMGFSVSGKLAKTKIYYLDEGGATLLRVFRQRDLGDWRPAHNVRSLGYVFRLLIANELFVKLVRLTNFLAQGDGLGLFEIEPSLHLQDKLFLQPTAQFNFARDNGSKSIRCLVEVLRGNDIEYVPSKLRKYNDWYLRQNSGDPTVLFFITEQEDQAANVDKMIAAMGLNELHKWCRYTTDAHLASRTLDRAFFKIVRGEIEDIPVGIFTGV